MIELLLVALIASAGIGIGFGTALVFDALISATDSVAVVALFRSVGDPKRLTVLVEGESLLNDGTATVVYNSDGVISEQVFDEVVADLDAQLAGDDALESEESERASSG